MRKARWLSTMRLFIGLLAYLIGSAALALGAAALFVVLAEPAVTSLLARPESKAVAPRIQAWLDREAEAIVYAKRARATSLAEEETWKALAARIRIPTTADYAALAKAHAEHGRAPEREVSARTREDARRKPARQAPRLREAPQVPPIQPAASQQQYPDIHARIY